MITEQVHALLLQEFEPLSEPQKTALIDFARASIELAVAADNYDDEASSNEGDDNAEEKTGNALLVIASSVKNTVDTKSKEAFLTAIKAVYTDPDPALENAGETLLDKAVSYREKAGVVVSLFPPPEPA